MSSRSPKPTVTEYIAVLARSSSPTLIVEGKDDFSALSNFEIDNVSWGFTVMAVSGRDNVLKIFDSRSGRQSDHVKFLVDKDTWVLDGVPTKLISDNIVLTDGYSIENDLIRDGKLECLLKYNERTNFEKDLDEFARFFRVAAFLSSEGNHCLTLSAHPAALFIDVGKLKPEIEATILEHEQRTGDVYRDVVDNPLKTVRGKSLLGLLLRYLSHSDRLSKYSAANLMELGTIARGEYLRRIEDDVLKAFGQNPVLTSSP